MSDRTTRQRELWAWAALGTGACVSVAAVVPLGPLPVATVTAAAVGLAMFVRARLQSYRWRAALDGYAERQMALDAQRRDRGRDRRWQMGGESR